VETNSALLNTAITFTNEDRQSNLDGKTTTYVGDERSVPSSGRESCRYKYYICMMEMVLLRNRRG